MIAPSLARLLAHRMGARPPLPLFAPLFSGCAAGPADMGDTPDKTGGGSTRHNPMPPLRLLLLPLLICSTDRLRHEGSSLTAACAALRAAAVAPTARTTLPAHAKKRSVRRRAQRAHLETARCIGSDQFCSPAGAQNCRGPRSQSILCRNE